MQNQYDLPGLGEVPVVKLYVGIGKNHTGSRVRMIPAEGLPSFQTGIRLGFLEEFLQGRFVVRGKDQIRSMGVLAT